MAAPGAEAVPIAAAVAAAVVVPIAAGDRVGGPTTDGPVARGGPAPSEGARETPVTVERGTVTGERAAVIPGQPAATDGRLVATDRRLVAPDEPVVATGERAASAGRAAATVDATVRSAGGTSERRVRAGTMTPASRMRWYRVSSTAQRGRS